MTALSLVILLLALGETTAGAQPVGCHTDSSAEAFVACAQAGTERYRDRAIAVLDGYRRVGSDFPGMGEHWIRMALVFDGTIDARQPEVLIYVFVGGVPRLLGVAFVVPLLAGEQPPAHPIGREAWHDHSRTLEDETVLPMHHAPDSGEGARLAMLHAWIWSPNPAGMFAADNWAIPYIRLGLTPDRSQAGAVAKALSLAAGGRGYVERAIHAAARPSDNERQRVAVALDRAEALVTAIARDLQGPDVDEPAAGKLASAWAGLWLAIDAALGTEARGRLSALVLR